MTEAMKKFFAVLLVLSLVACTSIVKVDGEQTIRNRMSLKLADAWNKVQLPNDRQPFDVWTQEGLTVDTLRFWAAVPHRGELVRAPSGSVPQGGKATRVPTFVTGMEPDQLVNLFETMYSSDGSSVTINKVEPTIFAGEKGIRFEFSVLRKSDDVQLLGIGWVAVKKDELFAATFLAPKLSFFSRLRGKAESVVKSAQIKG
jgi:hypothetical protein